MASVLTPDAIHCSSTLLPISRKQSYQNKALLLSISFFMLGRKELNTTDGSHLMYHKLAKYSYASQGKQDENLHKIEWHTRARQE